MNWISGKSLPEKIEFIFEKVMMLAFAGLSALYILFLCKRTYIFAEVPAEYRDGAVFKVIDMFAKGDNPYSVAWLKGNEAPPVLLDSGFLHVFPAVLFQKLFDVPASLACWIGNLIYVVLAGIIIYIVANKLTRSSLLALIAMCIQLTTMRRHGLLCSRPDMMAVVLLLMITYICIKERKTYDYIIIAVLSVLILFSKIHYAVIVVSVGIHIIYEMFLEKNIKNGIKRLATFVVSGMVTLLISIFLMMKFVPMHLPVWGIRLWNMFSYNTGNKSSQYKTVYDKFTALFHEYSYIKYVVIISVVGFAITFICSKVMRDRGSKLSCDRDFKIDNISFLIINAIINAVALLFVGRHDGAVLWYFYCMLMPTVILLAVCLLSHLKVVRYVQILILLLGCIKMIYPTVMQSYYMDVNRFDTVYSLVEEYESDQMYLTPMLSNYSIMHNHYNFSYGDTVFLPQTDSISPQLLEKIPYVDDINKRFNEYQDVIIETVKNREYSIIVTDAVDGQPASEEFHEALSANYQLIKEENQQNETQSIQLRYWIPMD